LVERELLVEKMYMVERFGCQQPVAVKWLCCANSKDSNKRRQDLKGRLESLLLGRSLMTKRWVVYSRSRRGDVGFVRLIVKANLSSSREI
jgi:hypothetical protein